MDFSHVEVVQAESFLDDSLISELQFEMPTCKVPILEEMPSIDLISVGSVIMTPRDFEEFARDARLSSDNMQSRTLALTLEYLMKRKYVKAETTTIP